MFEIIDFSLENDLTDYQQQIKQKLLIEEKRKADTITPFIDLVRKISEIPFNQKEEILKKGKFYMFIYEGDFYISEIWFQGYVENMSFFKSLVEKKVSKTFYREFDILRDFDFEKATVKEKAVVFDRLSEHFSYDQMQELYNELKDKYFEIIEARRRQLEMIDSKLEVGLPVFAFN
jgi:hypothetical protein